MRLFGGAGDPDDDRGDEAARGKARELGEDPILPAGDVNAPAALERAEAFAGDFFSGRKSFAADHRRVLHRGFVLKAGGGGARAEAVTVT